MLLYSNLQRVQSYYTPERNCISWGFDLSISIHTPWYLFSNFKTSFVWYFVDKSYFDSIARREIVTSINFSVLVIKCDTNKYPLKLTNIDILISNSCNEWCINSNCTCGPIMVSSLNGSNVIRPWTTHPKTRFKVFYPMPYNYT